MLLMCLSGFAYKLKRYSIFGIHWGTVMTLIRLYIRGHPKAFREGEVLRQFQGEILVKILDFPV